MFSIVSSDNHSIISNQKNILKNYFSEPIILGKQFFYDGYIINNKKYLGKQGKIEQILTYIDKLSKKI